MRAFSSRGSIISSNDGGTRAVSLDISGPDLASLYATAEAAYRRAGTLSNGRRSVRRRRPVSRSATGRGSSALAYASPSSASVPRSSLAASALSVPSSTNSSLDDDKVDISSSAAPATARPDALGSQPLLLPSGAIRSERSRRPGRDRCHRQPALRRWAGARFRSISFRSAQRRARNRGRARARPIVAGDARSGELPDNILVNLSGASDQLEATRKSLGGNFIAVVLSYLVLVAIFTHWGYPLMIMITVPLGSRRRHTGWRCTTVPPRGCLRSA